MWCSCNHTLNSLLNCLRTQSSASADVLCCFILWERAETACLQLEKKKRLGSPYLNWPQVPCNSILCVTLHVSSLPFPPKCFPKAYESTYSFHHSRIFLLYCGNKWPYLVQLSKRWEAIFKKLSGSYRGEGDKEKKKKE